MRLVVTSWAKAHFEVMHTLAYPLDPGAHRVVDAPVPAPPLLSAQRVFEVAWYGPGPCHLPFFTQLLSFHVLPAEWAATATSAEAEQAAVAAPASPNALQPDALAAAGFAVADDQEALLLDGLPQAFPPAQPPLAPEAGFAAGGDLLPAVAALAEDEELLPVADEEMLAALLADLPAAAEALYAALPIALGGGEAAPFPAPAPLPALGTPAAPGAAPGLLAAALQLGPPAAAPAATAASGLCPSPSGELSLDGHLC